MHTRVAVYYRVSSQEQKRKETIETQRAVVEPLVARDGLIVVGTYADDGVSGTIPLAHRPEGARLIADAQAGQFDMLLVYRVDRLGRSTIDGLQTVQELADHGVLVRSATEPLDTTTAMGRFMLTQLFAFGAFERESLLQRSKDGTDRLAREGAWLGGIVPFGYRVEGEDRYARLVIADTPLPGCEMSEADVIRLIYRMLGDEGASCQKVADRLNAIGVPPAYVRDGRKVQRGKRTQATQGLWRAGRIRNMVISTTYKGIHQYGKRSATPREIIERPVPAIVTPEVWQRAQTTLRKNMMSSPIAKHKYLLRGLIKCGCCGLTYCGTGWSGAGGATKRYYTCNGRSQRRGIYGAKGQKCPAKAISADLEELVWADIDAWARNPGPIVQELQARVAERNDEAASLRGEIAVLERALAHTQQERDAVLTLYRKGRIDGTSLDRQLDAVAAEEATLTADLERIRARMQASDETSRVVVEAEHLLRELGTRLDGPLSWETRRDVVEALVAGIVVETVEQNGKRHAVAHVTYRFTEVTIRTDRDSSQRSK